jgi:hypothetical protein
MRAASFCWYREGWSPYNKDDLKAPEATAAFMQLARFDSLLIGENVCCLFQYLSSIPGNCRYSGGIEKQRPIGEQL